jgi:hypothetical protein
MPLLTPALPSRYRRHALAALDKMMTRAQGDVADHRATVTRLAAAQEDVTAAHTRLGLAEHVLMLLRGRQLFLRSSSALRDGG